MLRICARLPARLVIVPLPEQSMQELGLPSCGWLKRLKISARNCAFTRSPMGNPLATARSVLKYLGPYRELRLPKFSLLGRVNPPPEAPFVVKAATGVKNCRNGLPLDVCKPPTPVLTLPVFSAQQGPASMSDEHSL